MDKQWSNYTAVLGNSSFCEATKQDGQYEAWCYLLDLAIAKTPLPRFTKVQYPNKHFRIGFGSTIAKSFLGNVLHREGWAVAGSIGSSGLSIPFPTAARQDSF